MRASRLIARLKQLIEEHGDEEVYFVGDDETAPVAGVDVAADGTFLLEG